jgi:transcription elongation factor Elf1
MKILQCECCDGQMVEVKNSSKYLYFSCGYCGFQTTRDFNLIAPYADYSEYNIGDEYYINNLSDRIDEAKK